MENVVIIYIKHICKNSYSLIVHYIVHRILSEEKFEKEYSSIKKLNLFEKTKLDDDFYAELFNFEK